MGAGGPVRARFAPSPTGSLHVGGVRTALYSMLLARQTHGAFVLRIEDTDRVRSTEAAAQGIVRDLRWAGVLWDEGPERDHPQYGPYFQSERLELYRRHAERLVDAGHAYRAWETGAELEAERKLAESRKENYRYRQRPYTDAQLAAFAAEGRSPVIRLVAPRKPISFVDVILGEVAVDADTVDDFVLIKADGFPTYHFAVVVDDHYMEIGLVLRGQEHLMNTHKHLLLYEAFGWTPPEHGHLPLIFSPKGARMSKRDKAKAAREAAQAAAKAAGADGSDWSWLAVRCGLEAADCTAFMKKQNDGVATAEAIAKELAVDLPMIDVMDFRKAGYLPEALVNYLALLGWAPGDDRELLTLDELVKSFSVDRVNKTPARFNADKLAWMNSEYLRSLPEDVLLERLASWLEVVPESPIASVDAAGRRRLLAMYRPRAKTFRDIERLGAFLFRAPRTFAEAQVKKHLDEDGWRALGLARAALADVDVFEPEPLKATLDQLAVSASLPIGRVAQPIRIALTGDGVSPELPEVLAFLGRTEVLARLDALLRQRPH